MRKFIISLALIGAVAAAAPAYAQQANIAVIDTQRIMRDSLPTKSIGEQINKYRTTYQADITKQENDLRAAEQELNKQRTIISAEAFADRRRAFEQRVGNLQRDVENRKRELDKSVSSAMSTVQASLNKIIQDMVEERKYTLVLPKSQTIFNSPAMEVTDDVMARLNKALPSVKVPPPAAPAAAPAAAAPKPAGR